MKRKASIEKARKILGYEPKVDIRTGLKRTYEWVLENKERIEQAAKLSLNVDSIKCEFLL